MKRVTPTNVLEATGPVMHPNQFALSQVSQNESDVSVANVSSRLPEQEVVSTNDKSIKDAIDKIEQLQAALLTKPDDARNASASDKPVQDRRAWAHNEECARKIDKINRSIKKLEKTISDASTNLTDYKSEWTWLHLQLAQIYLEQRKYKDAHLKIKSLKNGLGETHVIARILSQALRDEMRMLLIPEEIKVDDILRRIKTNQMALSDEAHRNYASDRNEIKEKLQILEAHALLIKGEIDTALECISGTSQKSDSAQLVLAKVLHAKCLRDYGKILRGELEHNKRTEVASNIAAALEHYSRAVVINGNNDEAKVGYAKLKFFSMYAKLRMLKNIKDHPREALNSALRAFEKVRDTKTSFAIEKISGDEVNERSIEILFAICTAQLFETIWWGPKSYLMATKILLPILRWLDNPPLEINSIKILQWKGEALGLAGGIMDASCRNDNALVQTFKDDARHFFTAALENDPDCLLAKQGLSVKGLRFFMSEEDSDDEAIENARKIRSASPGNRVAAYLANLKYLNSGVYLPIMFPRDQGNDAHEDEMASAYKTYKLAKPSENPAPNDAMTEIEIATQGEVTIQCTYLTSASEGPVGSDRITMVFAARKEHAYLPEESAGGRVILLLTEEEAEFGRGQVRPNQDVAIIKGMKIGERVIAATDAALHPKLIFARRLAAFLLAKHFKLNDYIALDDNVTQFNVHADNVGEGELTWKNLYGLLKTVSQKEEQNGKPAVVSVRTKRFDHKQWVPNEPITELDIREGLASKIFFYPSGSMPVEILVQDFLPPRLNIMGSDIFTSAVLLNHGYRFVFPHYRHMTIERSPAQRNYCKATVEKGEAWLSFEADQFKSAHAKAAFRDISELLQKSIDTHKKALERMKSRSIFAASAYLPRDSFEGEVTSLELAFRRSLQELIQRNETHGLRPHQVDAIKAASTSSKMRNLFKLPTGAGKTILFLRILNQLRQKHDSMFMQKNIAIVACNLTLVNQIYAAIERYNAIMTQVLTDAGITADEQARFKFDIKRDVKCISSHNVPQNLLAHGVDRQGRGKIYIFCDLSFKAFLDSDERSHDMFNTIIVDEVHRMSDELMEDITRRSGDADSPMMVLGFDATPDKRLKYFEETVYEQSISDARKSSIIAPHIVATLPKEYSAKLDKENIDSFQKRLPEFLCETIHPNGQPLSELRGIIFVDSQKRAKAIMDLLNQAKLNAEAVFTSEIDGFKPNETRAVQKYENSTKMILVAVDKLDVGFDSCVDFELILKNRRSPIKTIQQAGRAFRKTPQRGKNSNGQDVSLTGDEKIALIITFEGHALGSLPQETLIGYEDSSRHPLADTFVKCIASNDSAIPLRYPDAILEKIKDSGFVIDSSDDVMNDDVSVSQNDPEPYNSSSATCDPESGTESDAASTPDTDEDILMVASQQSGSKSDMTTSESEWDEDNSMEGGLSSCTEPEYILSGYEGDEDISMESVGQASSESDSLPDEYDADDEDSEQGEYRVHISKRHRNSLFQPRGRSDYFDESVSLAVLMAVAPDNDKGHLISEHETQIPRLA